MHFSSLLMAFGPPFLGASFCAPRGFFGIAIPGGPLLRASAGQSGRLTTNFPILAELRRAFVAPIFDKFDPRRLFSTDPAIKDRHFDILSRQKILKESQK